MKILHLTPTYIPAYNHGGPITSVHYLNKWLVKKGVDVTVYTTDINGKETLDVPLRQEVDIEGVKVFYFKNSFPRRWEYSKALYKNLGKDIKNFDLIHITSVFLAASKLGSKYAMREKKPYIISPRGSLMKEPVGIKSPIKKQLYLSLIEKKNLKNADAIHFTVGQEEKEYKEQNLPLKRSIIIPNGMDIENKDRSMSTNLFREKYNIPNDKKIILFLSRIDWKKGLDTLIPAFARIVGQRDDVVLVIAGNDDGYQKKAERMIEKRKIKERVVLTGFIKGDEKYAALRESDVFTLPSYSENFGMSVVEAMAEELPVVITKGVGIWNEVQNAGAGKIIEKDEKQLAEALIQVLDNKKEARIMGKRGKDLVDNAFNMEAIADKWIDAYKGLICP